MQDQGDERLKQMDEDVKSHGKKHSFLDTNVMRSCHVRDERSSRTCRGICVGIFFHVFQGVCSIVS